MDDFWSFFFILTSFIQLLNINNMYLKLQKIIVAYLQDWLFSSFFNLNLFVLMEANYFTILYWFCHTSTWIRHGCTHAPHPEPPSHLPSCTLPLGHPSAPAPSILYPASNLDWRFVSYMILYMFQCHSPKSFFIHLR